MGRIPNLPQYDEAWVKATLERNFAGVISANVMNVNQIPSNFPGARTKTFKVVIELNSTSQIPKLQDAQIWISGTKVNRYRHPRKKTGQINQSSSNTGNTGPVTATSSFSNFPGSSFSGNNNANGNRPSKSSSGTGNGTNGMGTGLSLNQF